MSEKPLAEVITATGALMRWWLQGMAHRAGLVVRAGRHLRHLRVGVAAPDHVSIAVDHEERGGQLVPVGHLRAAAIERVGRGPLEAEGAAGG